MYDMPPRPSLPYVFTLCILCSHFRYPVTMTTLKCQTEDPVEFPGC